MIRATLILFAFSFSGISVAETISPSAAKHIYQRFEHAFYGTDPVLASEWLPDGYELEQRQLVMDLVEETRTISRERILVNIEQGAHNNALRPPIEDVQVVEQGQNSFCVRADVEGKTEFLGRPVYEHSQRHICFKIDKDRWQVASHNIETRFSRSE